MCMVLRKTPGIWCPRSASYCWYRHYYYYHIVYSRTGIKALSRQGCNQNEERAATHAWSASHTSARYSLQNIFISITPPSSSPYHWGREWGNRLQVQVRNRAQTVTCWLGHGHPGIYSTAYSSNKSLFPPAARLSVPWQEINLTACLGLGGLHPPRVTWADGTHTVALLSSEFGDVSLSGAALANTAKHDSKSIRPVRFRFSDQRDGLKAMAVLKHPSHTSHSQNHKALQGTGMLKFGAREVLSEDDSSWGFLKQSASVNRIRLPFLETMPAGRRFCLFHQQKHFNF